MKSRTNQLDPRIIGGLRAVIMPNDVLDEKQVTHYPLPLHGMVGYAVECLMDRQNLATENVNKQVNEYLKGRGNTNMADEMIRTTNND